MQEGVLPVQTTETLLGEQHPQQCCKPLSRVQKNDRPPTRCALLGAQ
jgi:hypothetical protein